MKTSHSPPPPPFFFQAGGASIYIYTVLYAFKEMLIRRMLYLGKLSKSSAYWKTLTLGLRSADLESRDDRGNLESSVEPLYPMFLLTFITLPVGLE